MKGTLYGNGVLITHAGFNIGNPEITKHATDKKTYSIRKSTYWKICASAINLYNTRSNAVTFVTFTFGCDIDCHSANYCFSKFLDNFKKTYRLKSYIWTRELTERGRPHFHMICDFPFVPIQTLNDAWNHAKNEFDMPSKNSVRLPPDGSIIKSMDRCIRYVCKYVSKTLGQTYDTRCYSISRNVLSKPLKLSDAGVKFYRKHCNTTAQTEQSSEYFTVFYSDNIAKTQEISEIIKKTSEYTVNEEI